MDLLRNQIFSAIFEFFLWQNGSRLEPWREKQQIVCSVLKRAAATSLKANESALSACLTTLSAFIRGKREGEMLLRTRKKRSTNGFALALHWTSSQVCVFRFNLCDSAPLFCAGAGSFMRATPCAKHRPVCEQHRERRHRHDEPGSAASSLGTCEYQCSFKNLI